MLRLLGKFAVAFGAVALLGSPAWAQGGRGFGMGGGTFILMAPNVQKDLKLSDEQIGKVQDTLREVREKHADDFADLRDLPQNERMEKMRALNKTIVDEVKKGVALSDEQSKRFDQISLQARGFQAFNDPTVQEKLKLTDEQRSKVRELAEASRGQFPGAFNKDASQEEREAARKKMTELNKENMNKVLALLNDDQKKAWKDLTGEPIEIQFPRRPNQ